MAIPLAREEQTDLPQTVKVRFTGKLRSRLGERHADYVLDYSGEEPEISDDADPYDAAIYRALVRQKTNVVMETAEEAESLFSQLSKFTDARDVTWNNGPMAKAARRVRFDIKEQLQEIDGVDVMSSGYGLDVEVNS